MNLSAKRTLCGAASALALTAAAAIMTDCGQAKPLTTGPYLGNAEIGDGGSRSDGNNLGNLYEVVQISTATDGTFAGWAANQYPFARVPILFNDTTTDRQVPFTFNYSYPPNNYKLNEAHVVI